MNRTIAFQRSLLEMKCGILRSYLICAAYEALWYFYNVCDKTNGETILTASNGSYLI